MVVASLLFIVASGGMLVAGIVFGNDPLVIASIGVSGVAAVLLFLGMRREPDDPFSAEYDSPAVGPASYAGPGSPMGYPEPYPAASTEPFPPHAVSASPNSTDDRPTMIVQLPDPHSPAPPPVGAGVPMAPPAGSPPPAGPPTVVMPAVGSSTQYAPPTQHTPLVPPTTTPQRPPVLAGSPGASYPMPPASSPVSLPQVPPPVTPPPVPPVAPPQAPPPVPLVAPPPVPAPPAEAPPPPAAPTEPEIATFAQADDFDDPPGEPPAELLLSTEERRLSAMDYDVLVVDGRPRYHVPECSHLKDRPSQAIPVSEAAELGFTPCSQCSAATTLLMRDF